MLPTDRNLVNDLAKRGGHERYKFGQYSASLGIHLATSVVQDHLEGLAFGVVDVTCGCQNGVTISARWHDDPMADLERIKAESVAYFRSLDEGATLRQHFRHVDEEGGLWYFEVVPDLNELVAVKQAELTPAGRLHRYSWEHLEDEHGFLTDQAIDPAEDPLEAISAGEFQEIWNRRTH